MTVATIIMDVTAGRMWVRMAPWKNTSTEEYAL